MRIEQGKCLVFLSLKVGSVPWCGTLISSIRCMSRHPNCPFLASAVILRHCPTNSILYYKSCVAYILSMTECVLFMRCSTKEQGTKWSIKRQQDALHSFCSRNGFTVLAEYEEVASGGLSIDQRPALKEALSFAASKQATILVLDVSRLSRDVEMIAGFLNRGVRFCVSDAPDASHFELQLRAVFAEEYRRKLRARVKHGLATAKRHGKVLGSPTLDRDRPKAWAALKENADKFALDIAPIIEELNAAGITSASGIARALNSRGVSTRRGGNWHASTVLNILKRLK